MSGVGVRLSGRLQARVSDRVLLAVSRFGPHLLRVTVRLATVPNLLGGVDRRCEMRATLRPAAQVHSEAISDAIESAVARAVERLARRITRTLLAGADREPPRADDVRARPHGARPTQGAPRRGR